MFAKTFVRLSAIFSGVLCALCDHQTSFAQSGRTAQSSEMLISYDYANPESKTSIPFDKFFTFQVLHFNTQKINTIKVFEAEFVKGVRTLKTDYKDADRTPHAVFDFKFNPGDFKVKHDTLLLYFPPLKPNREFDIVITRFLTNENLDLSLKLNEAIYQDKPVKEQEDLFNSLAKGAKAIAFNLTDFIPQDLAAYKQIYTANFKTYYDDLKNRANFPVAPFLTLTELNNMNTGYVQKDIKFKWGFIPVRLITENKLSDFFTGNLPADYTSSTVRTEDVDYKGRVANLDKSIAVMDTLYRNLNTFLFKENNAVFERMRAKLQKVIEQLGKNKYYINKKISDLTTNIQSQATLQETQVLINNTAFKDVKTEGSNIFTLDLGLATIGGFNTQNQMVLLPKFYYGVNIYFRPIDKNTRRETLPSGLKADPMKGPDYNIQAQKSVWQHLSMTVGLTTGSYNNKEFDNLYANTSLLVGAGYRFYRALKVTGGVAFLKRSSKNPVITDKGLCASPFISFSADIDFVSTIKDVISPLWK